MTTKPKTDDQKILDLLNTREEANLHLAFQLCANTLGDGNYSNLVAQQLRKDPMACRHYKVEKAHFDNLERLNLNYQWINSLDWMIGEFPSIKVLDLNGNLLSQLPTEINKLQNLTHLNISSNQFSNFPTPITQLQNLQILNLDTNNLETLPPQLADLQQLRKLNLHANKLLEIPTVILKLENLIELSIGENKISDFSLISQLTNLQTLTITESLSSINQIPEEIKDLENLYALKLNYNNISTLPNWLTQVGQERTGLMHLGLAGNRIESAEDIKVIKELPSLGLLDLWENPLTESEKDEITSWLPSCKVRFQKFR